MTENSPSREQLMAELALMRRRTAKLEEAENERKQAEEELARYRGHLEELVKERTAALARANEQLTREIQERKKVEQALQEWRQMLQSVLDTIPVRVFWKDLHSTYLGCNRPFARDAGLQSAEEIIGKNDFEMGWAEQADLYRTDDHLVMTTGKPKLGYEEPQTTPNGGRIWLRTNKVPLLDAQGRIKGVLGTYEDITASKQLEESLRISETKYRIVADNTHDWEYWASPEGRFLYLSPSCRRITGYAASEFEADLTLFSRIVHPDDMTRCRAHLEQAQPARAPCEMAGVRCPRPFSGASREQPRHYGSQAGRTSIAGQFGKVEAFCLLRRPRFEKSGYWSLWSLKTAEQRLQRCP